MTQDTLPTIMDQVPSTATAEAEPITLAAAKQGPNCMVTRPGDIAPTQYTDINEAYRWARVLATTHRLPLLITPEALTALRQSAALDELP